MITRRHFSRYFFMTPLLAVAAHLCDATAAATFTMPTMLTPIIIRLRHTRAMPPADDYSAMFYFWHY